MSDTDQGFILSQLHASHHGALILGPAARIEASFQAVAAVLFRTLPPGDRVFRMLSLVPQSDRAIGIDTARDIIAFCSRKVTAIEALQVQKLVTIGQADKLTQEAQNALLKVLEEPPKGVFFLLGADRAENVLATVRSRVQTLVLPNKNPIQSEHDREVIQRVRQLLEQPLARRLALLGELVDDRHAVVTFLDALSNIILLRIEIFAEKGETAQLQRELERARTVEATRHAVAGNSNIKIWLLKALLGYA